MPVNQRKERKYYTAGLEKPPTFVQAIIDNKEMSADDFFQDRKSTRLNSSH